ncbi:MAG: macro domain-containing protein [Oscillospiraceae bacterium]|nr:macro domain-containing protein [Oscillospiraceae bacterium]
MTFSEIQGDLFTRTDCVLCHCISSDFALGAGIAKKFAQMGVKKQLRENFPSEWQGRGYCLITKTNSVVVGNLVTKQRYFHKPTLETLRQALYDFREQAIQRGLRKIAMPKIGCGLDKLQWEDVREIIQDVLKDTNLEIFVYYL